MAKRTTSGSNVRGVVRREWTYVGWAVLVASCTAELGTVDDESVSRDETGASTSALTDHRWPFDRATPPEPAYTASQRAARDRLHQAADDAQARAERLRPDGARLGDSRIVGPDAWRDASQSELETATRLSREALPASLRDRWIEDLDVAMRKAGGPDAMQEAAVERLARDSFGQFRLRWYHAMGTPAELGPLGDVSRGVTPVEAWRGFQRKHRSSVDALFDPESRCRAVLRDAVDEGSGQFTILRYARRCDDLPISGQHLHVYVTSEQSLAGAGVVWKVKARWRRGLDGLLPASADRSTWLSAAEAREAAGASEDAHAALRYNCGERCVPEWRVERAPEEVVTVDAVTGERRRSWDPRLRGGPIYIGSYPPGAPTLTGVRFRGADVTDYFDAPLGWTDRTDATYNFSSVNEPYQIGHAGGMPVGTTWPTGRVDRRYASNWDLPRPTRKLWWPSLAPNQDFSDPDLWAPNGTTLPHAAAITYGWLTYWQDLFRQSAWVGVQVPDTVSYVLKPAGGQGLGGCQAHSVSYGPPNSGQSTWAVLDCDWSTSDDVESNPAQDISLMAHEYGHTIINCAAVPGCLKENPGGSSWRPPNPADWKRDVWDASQENQANMYGAILAEFRDPTEAGYGGAFEVYQSDWTYAGYASTTDDFGTALQDSAGMINCNKAGFDCPTGYACVTPTDESPDADDGGVCARICDDPNDCGERLYCRSGWGMNTVPSTDKICWKNSYVNAWFTTVGSRLTMDIGWRWGLKNFALAEAGNSDNGTRDFTLGADTWYDQLVDANAFTRLEVTRAVRSVSAESGVPERDDLTGLAANAVPVTVINESGTPIWWGSGWADYPNFEDWLDFDVVLFRGLQGNNYHITAEPVAGSTANLTAYVYRWEDNTPLIASGSAPSGPDVSLHTGTLSQTAWYAVLFSTAYGTSGAWQGRIALGTGSDDFHASVHQAYPMPSGVTVDGNLQSSFDSDLFSVHVPTAGTSLLVTTNSSVPALVTVYRPDGSVYGSAWSTYSIPSIPEAGHWRWRVYDAHSIPRTYTTRADLGCASASSSSCDDLTTDPPESARYSWGDWFAGRLPTGTSTAKYTVDLDAYQEFTASLAHNSDTSCRLQLDVHGPAAMAYFGGQRIARWQDLPGSGGAASNGPDSTRLGAGGHVTAMVPGTYQVVVSSSNQLAGCHYRLFMAKGTMHGKAMPEW